MTARRYARLGLAALGAGLALALTACGGAGGNPAGDTPSEFRTRFSGASHIGSSSVTPKASWKASMLRTIWLHRNSVGECGSVAI